MKKEMLDIRIDNEVDTWHLLEGLREHEKELYLADVEHDGELFDTFVEHTDIVTLLLQSKLRIMHAETKTEQNELIKKAVKQLTECEKLKHKIFEMI